MPAVFGRIMFLDSHCHLFLFPSELPEQKFQFHSESSFHFQANDTLTFNREKVKYDKHEQLSPSFFINIYLNNVSSSSLTGFNDSH